MFEDKELQCVDCGATFVFTAKDQAFYQEKGFNNEPKRCKTCRDKRKGSGRHGGSSKMQSRPRRMFPATCSVCGKPTEVPFKPAPGRPVKCRSCMGSVSVSP